MDQRVKQEPPYTSSLERVDRSLWRRIMPRSLYGRALVIIIAPIVILQSVLAFVFMERHWSTVTHRLSDAVTRDVAAIIQIMEAYPGKESEENVVRIAREQLDLNLTILPPDSLPKVSPKPFFTFLDRTLSNKISEKIGKPFWIDTVGRSKFVEIRIQLEDKVVQIFARRSQTYASNSYIFLTWMGGTSLILIAIAILFMRNQIKPIQRLANAAEDFGRGRDHPDFRAAGANEVRRASLAFIKMRTRIQRQLEQRTAMLAGVSHDLRTILTRFKLQMAILEEKDEINNMEQDVNDMQVMLEGYLAFARDDMGEQSSETNIEALIDELCRHAELENKTVTRTFEGEPFVEVRPLAFKRCLNNVGNNAIQYADTLKIEGVHKNKWLTIIIEDDGPGIAEEERENVFRPFYRLDEARNLNKDHAGTGLGLAIALDIARIHGGDITLDDSDLGGLKATIRIPV